MTLRTMKNMREIEQATTTNQQSRGVLLLLDHGDDDEDVGEGGDPPVGDPGGVSPSNLLCSSLRFRVSMFMRGSLPENSLGTYIQ